MNVAYKSNRQGGFIAIEILIGLVVVAILTTLGIQASARYADSQNYLVAAQQQQRVADAAAKYLKDNFATVYASAGTTTPALITTAMLRNTNYLPASFSDTNAFGQAFQVLARRVATNQLETIVITTGGQVIDEMGTREIAENLGAPGGFIPVSTPTIVQGLRGGWSLALSNYGISPGAGHTASALFLEDGTLANDYLYRNAIPGKPELNRMNTALNMGSNDITNGNNATFAGDVAAANVTSSGNVTAANTVKAVTTDTSGETYTGGWFRTRRDGGWYSEKWNGGWYMQDSDWVRAYANKGVYTQGQIKGGTLASEGRASVGEYLQLQGTATEGATCSPNGLVSRDAQGALLSCQSGTWRKQASENHWGGSFFYASWASGGCGTANPYTGSCSCPVGYAAYNQLSIQVGGCGPCISYGCYKP